MCFTKCFIRIALVLVVCVCVSAQSKPAGGSLIKGRVIYADTGQPLRRATVTLMTQDEVRNAQTFSDRNGEFVFNDVSAGKYFVVVDALDTVSPSMAGEESSLKLKIALGQIDDGFSEVTVDGRSTVKTEIRASRGGVITGRVLNESDEPIANARLTLFQLDHGKLRLAVSAARLLEEDKGTLETDSRGVYRIAGLATGEYIVRASESDEGGEPDDAADGSYTNGSMMVAFYPKAVRVQDATSVKVQQGSEPTDVDIRFTERIAHRISGTVSLRGKPLSNIELNLTRDEPDDLNRDPFEAPQARSDENGQWEIRTVPDGRYTLSASGAFKGMVRLDNGQGWVSVAPLQREVIVEGGDVTNLNVEVFGEAKVKGTVSLEGGASLPEQAYITLVPSEAAAAKYLESSGSIDKKGAFEIVRLSAGSFRFAFVGLRDCYVKSITLKDKDLLRNPIKIESGQSLTGVTVVLSAELVSLSGRVVQKDDRSKPLRNGTVVLIAAEAERRRMSDEPLIVSSDKDGRFAFKSAPGEYFVMVIDRARKSVAVELPSEASLVKNGAGLQKIKLQRGDEKKVVEVVGP